MGKGSETKMKKQNEPNKTNYYSPYAEKMPSQRRIIAMIDEIPEHCWWLKQYLRGTMFARKGRMYVRD